MKMIWIFLAIIVLLVGVAVVRAMRTGEKAPSSGTPAPEFTLNSQDGKPLPPTHLTHRSHRRHSQDLSQRQRRKPQRRSPRRLVAASTVHKQKIVSAFPNPQPAETASMKAIRIVTEIDQPIAIVDFDLHLIQHREPQHPGNLNTSRIAHS